MRDTYSKTVEYLDRLTSSFSDALLNSFPLSTGEILGNEISEAFEPCRKLANIYSDSFSYVFEDTFHNLANSIEELYKDIASVSSIATLDTISSVFTESLSPTMSKITEQLGTLAGIDTSELFSDTFAEFASSIHSYLNSDQSVSELFQLSPTIHDNDKCQEVFERVSQNQPLSSPISECSDVGQGIANINAEKSVASTQWLQDFFKQLIIALLVSFLEMAHTQYLHDQDVLQSQEAKLQEDAYRASELQLEQQRLENEEEIIATFGQIAESLQDLLSRLDIPESDSASPPDSQEISDSAPTALPELHKSAPDSDESSGASHNSCNSNEPH